ncbi:MULTISPECIES: hypothetical protein [unclassified Kitasatospora]|uniref:hypothetical protein n=1 Tax=unclassified Kitasatospora TaxID=2633591 RepID=UPI00070C686E|nr:MULTISPECIES: hypothetical protein [unclassified Kitasatospora]KQV20090.1 hypothetical protein ASC99_22130 [Kitasatospora sp. Root107]KRB71181.1 hypothetical protein ASE03_24430 [Kitasatospora sp. Root187]
MSAVTNGWGSDHVAPKPGRLLIGLYPARYRAAHGEDIAAVFADATEGQSRRAVLRERRDLASHALRLRLRIGPTDPAGRVLAGAAPVALALAAGCALAFLLPNLRPMVHEIRYPIRGLGLRNALMSAVFILAYTAPWPVALAFAVLGRWRAARIAGVVATLLTLAVYATNGLAFAWVIGEMAATAAVGAVVLLAPSGLVDVTQRGRWEMAGIALAIGLPLGLGRQFGIDLSWRFDLLPVWLSVVTAAVLLGRLSARRPDRLLAFGVGLGVVPWMMPFAAAVLHGAVRMPTLLRYGGAFLAPLGAAVALAGVVHLARRVRATEPSDPA